MSVRNNKSYRYSDEDERRQSEPHKKRAHLLLEDLFPSRKASLDTRDITPVLVLDARVPLAFWRQGWVLRQIEDVHWKEITKDSPEPFPRNLRSDRKGHPAYVLQEIGNYALKICPCSSQHQSCLRIPKGAILKPTGLLMSKDSYIIERSAVTLPRSSRFPRIPEFLGIFPVEDLQY